MPASPLPSFRRSYVGLSVATGALFCAHLILALRLHGPVLFGDETAYLGIARFFAGLEPVQRLGSNAMSFAAFYHGGFSILVAPAYFLGAAPLTAYHFALAVNALLAAACLPLLWYFAHRVLGAPYRLAFAAAAAGATYPALVLLAKLAWPETLFSVLCVLLVLAADRLFAGPDGRRAAALALCSVAAYAAHPRGLGLVVLAGATILVLAGSRRLAPRATAAGMAALALGFGAAQLANRLLRDRLWSGVHTSGAGDLGARLLHFENLRAALVSLLGQLWYASVTSCGLAAIACLALLGAARADADLRRREIARFVLLASAVLFATSAGFMTDHDRVDKLIYGRYIESLEPMWIVCGLWALATRPPSLRSAALLLIAWPAALAVLLVLVHPPAAFATPLNPFNVIALEPLVLAMGGVRILRFTAVAAALAAGLYGLARRRPEAAAILLATLSAGGALYTYTQWLARLDRAMPETVAIPRLLHALGEPPALAYDEGHLQLRGFFAYPFWLDRVRFDMYAGGLPPQSLVISTRANESLRRAGGRLVFPERDNDQALWVMPGALQEQLVARGIVVAEDPRAPLSPAACSSRLRTAAPALTLASGAETTLPIAVEHRGAGSLWLAADTVVDAAHAVRIGARWFSANGTVVGRQAADLPHALWPGADAEVELPLRARDLDGHPLPAGTYRVRVGVYQESVLWCEDLGDTALALEVTVR